MTSVVGVICEYDPFHIGHARQFLLIRERLPDAKIVCVMSGCFTQRGMPALYTPAFRAERALLAGADAVLELPCLYAVREAEGFALGGVSLLESLGFVTHLSFGCETDDFSPLVAAAELLETPSARYRERLRAALHSGASFVSAQGVALSACAGEKTGVLLAQPNNILAVAYLRALKRLKTAILPLPVPREGGYHTTTLDGGYPSATAVRASILRGNIDAAQTACGYLPPSAPLHRPDALDAPLLWTLRGMTKDRLSMLPGCMEGLENRFYQACREATSRDELLSLVKTKRYAYARLSRMATHALLNVTSELVKASPTPRYARLLGLRDTHALRLSQSRIPIVSKAADYNRHDPVFALDERAYDAWALGAGLPTGLLYRQRVALAKTTS